ncbi:MAG: cysteine desulfurase family protein [Bacteroidota bacterium]
MPYLDHAATTPLRPEALDAMLPWLRDEYGNASSQHGPGRRARVAVENARKDVAAVLGCEPAEVVFTSGGTEADNLALRGTLTGGPLAETGRPGLVTSAAEHDAILKPAEDLRYAGHPVAIVPPLATGEPDPEALAAATTNETGLVSAMLVNNEVGAVADIRRIADDAHARGALCHTDAVQASGLLPLAVDDLGVDLLSISGHKVGGPKGAGALFVRSGTPLAPLVRGGAQERGRRGGTENVAALVGFATALRLAEAEREDTAARLTGLRQRLTKRLLAHVPGLRVNTPSEAAPHVLSVSLPPGDAGAIDGEMVLLGLDLAGVQASAGSACTSGALTPSHVLLAMGVPRQTAAATVRLSLGRTTTEADVDAAVEAFATVAARAGHA